MLLGITLATVGTSEVLSAELAKHMISPLEDRPKKGP